MKQIYVWFINNQVQYNSFFYREMRWSALCEVVQGEQSGLCLQPHLQL